MADPIRLGIIGANSEHGGWAARAHLPAAAASPDVELVAVCTNHQESAEVSAQKFGARLAFHDYREMLEHPEIDAVAVVVRVPSHFEPTRDAINAEKAVYTEWPLGRTTAEAVELTELAAAKGVPTAVGLQARVNPALAYMKDLIASGFVGEVLSCRVGLIRPGGTDRPSARSWQSDVTNGANTLTIAAGHTIDALTFTAGEFREVSSILSTQVKQYIETDTKQTVDVSSPDNVLISARVESGAVASVYVAESPWANIGFNLEVYGRDGVLVATGDTAPQYAEMTLRSAKGSSELTEMAVPEEYVFVPATMPKGAPFNVGQLYHQFARSIRAGEGNHPDFSTAVRLHELLDMARSASDPGQRI